MSVDHGLVALVGTLIAWVVGRLNRTLDTHTQLLELILEQLGGRWPAPGSIDWPDGVLSEHGDQPPHPTSPNGPRPHAQE